MSARPPRSGDDLALLIRVVATAVAIVIGLGVPATFAITHFHEDRARVEVYARVKASLVSDAINTDPLLWRFEENRLRTLVSSREWAERHAVALSILDADRRMIVDGTSGPLPWPVAHHEVVLYDATRPAGIYRVDWTMRPLMAQVGAVGAASLLLALAVAFPLRIWPLRALRRSQHRLSYLAHHDPLTGLPNRVLLDDRLSRAIAQAAAGGRGVTVVFLDIDHFKTVNDTLGHGAGDELLRQVAVRLQAGVRETDTVARLGGDEFAIVLVEQGRQADAAVGAVQRLRERLALPVELHGHLLRITFSLGLAGFPHDGTEAQVLLRCADVAMYRAKELGRNNVQCYTADMNTRLVERARLQQGLLEALEREQLRLVYQPQLELESGRMIGVEALLRWQHPELGEIAPARFVPLAEETGLIVPIGRWVLRTACRQQAAWRAQGLGPLTMSVNVSPRQFRESDWVETVAQAIDESGIEPRSLELEITESLIMEDLERAVQTMVRLDEMGVKLSIDDFGTGYSSLSALRRFPVARLKIDKSFVDGLPGTADDQTIATAIIALGHRLNMKVIAEGVETLQQRAFLQEHRCNEMQGYLFSRPVPPAQIEALLAGSACGERATAARQAAAPEAAAASR